MGILSLSALLAAVVLGMRGAEQWAARLLGLPRFRWFEAGTAPAWWWKRCLVRTASAFVPYAIGAAIFFVTIALGGVDEPTTTVTLLPESSAREAGMRDGDKVLAVGGVPIQTWDQLRAQVQAHTGPVQIVLERSGQRRELSVTPRGGRIGVTPVSQTRPASLGEAASRGAILPFTIVKAAAVTFVTWHQPTELKGPVGIVRDSGQATGRGWTHVLYFLGLLVSHFWPFAGGVHLFDAATSWTFRMTFADKGLPERTTQIARLAFTLYFALGCWGALVLAELAVGAELPGALPLIAVLMPGVSAIWPLLWVSSRELWGKSSLRGVLAPVSFLPCVAPALGIWLALRLKAEERRLRSHQEPGSAVNV